MSRMVGIINELTLASSSGELSNIARIAEIEEHSENCCGAIVGPFVWPER